MNVNANEALEIAEFAPIRDNDEKFLWAGRPHYVPYLATALPVVLIGILWGCMDLFLLESAHAGHNPQAAATLYPFFAMHSIPAWGSLLYLLWLVLSYKNVAYAITNRRIVLRSGVWAPNYQAIDFDKISEVDVTIGPLEKLMKCGTVRVNAGRTNSKGMTLFDSMVAIDAPYDVYKLLKETAVDVKTDWNYPNQLRPAENPGYHTDYKPQ
jgi:membrane protein YdbS with pleckstrin-like domain